MGSEPVDAALGVAAAAGRFAEGDLLAIVHHRANGASIASLVVADEDHSVQPGTKLLGQLRQPNRPRHRRRGQEGVLMTATATERRATLHLDRHDGGTRAA